MSERSEPTMGSVDSECTAERGEAERGEAERGEAMA